MKNVDYFEFAKSLNQVYAAGMQEGIEQEAQRQRVSEAQAREYDPEKVYMLEKKLDCHTLRQIGEKLIAWSDDYDELFTCEELQYVIDQLGALLDVSK